MLCDRCAKRKLKLTAVIDQFAGQLTVSIGSGQRARVILEHAGNAFFRGVNNEGTNGEPQTAYGRAELAPGSLLVLREISGILGNLEF